MNFQGGNWGSLLRLSCTSGIFIADKNTQPMYPKMLNAKESTMVCFYSDRIENNVYIHPCILVVEQTINAICNCTRFFKHLD